MKKIVRKLFWAWDFDREEKWLNEMSAKGLHLVGVGFLRYVFEESTPNEYEYRLELLDDLPSTKKSQEYLHFMEDMGAEYLGSVIRWVYFRKKRDADGFDLFSDLDSRIEHLNRVLLLISIITLLDCISFGNIVRGFHNYADATAIFVAWVVLFGSFTLLLLFGLGKTWGLRAQLVKERKLHE